MDQLYEKLSRRLDGFDATLKEIMGDVKQLLASQIKADAAADDAVLSKKRKRSDTRNGSKEHPAPETVVAPIADQGVEVLVNNMEFKSGQYTGVFQPMTNEMDTKSAEFISMVGELRNSRSGVFSLGKLMVLHDDDGENSPMADDDNDVMERYNNFKKFDTITDCSDHHFSAYPSPMNQEGAKDWYENIKKELKNLGEQMPDAMFVRVYEPRMDLLRAVIVGPQGTPYHDGLYFFDVHFPSSYPSTEPLVVYRSGGYCINQNLRASGVVHLVIAKTTGGVHEEKMWVPGTSNVLQLLVFLQKLLNSKKPLLDGILFRGGHADQYREHISLLYNETTYIKSLKTMEYVMIKPPRNFEAFVVGHFRNRVRDILRAYKAYTEGLLVGCPVEEGNKGVCSLIFKEDLVSCIKPLLSAFKKIGVEDSLLL